MMLNCPCPNSSRISCFFYYCSARALKIDSLLSRLRAAETLPIISFACSSLGILNCEPSVTEYDRDLSSKMVV